MSSKNGEAQAAGRRVAMRDARIKDVMTRSVITVEADETVQRAAQKLAENRIAGAPVVSKGRVVGMLTEQDIVRAMLPPIPLEGRLSMLEVLTHLDDVKNRPTMKTVRDAMSTLVVETSPEASVWEAATEMENRGVNRLPVLEKDGTLVGIVSRADLVRLMGAGPEE
jgi:CBS domain-containing protein